MSSRIFPPSDDKAAGGSEAVELLTAEIADDYMERVNRGEHPDVEEYARRYPQLADVLRDLLPALRAMTRSSEQATAACALWDREQDAEGCLGDYQIVREIARGGMGVVYEARQISLGRRVALKVLPFAAALDPKQLERFRREAQAAAHLHHTNIVPVYGVGCERGVYYYAMQYIEGQSLSQVIAGLRQMTGRAAAASEARSATLTDTIAYITSGAGPSESAADQQPGLWGSSSLAPPGTSAAERPTQTQAALSTEQSLRGTGFFRTVALLGIQAAEALEHAHALGVVHRDVKPANLLIDGHGHLWVTDFGLARYQTEADLTLTGDMLGTLRYMSPEQALGKRNVVDHRADIYSLGATLYELLTLEPIWNGADRHELLRQIAFDEPIAPRRISRAIPADLETIVQKALAKEPQDRYGSAQEMADDLRRFLENKPILARKPSVAERLTKWSRRHRSVVVSGVVLLVMAVVALAVSNVLIAQARSKTERALALLEEKQRETNAALLAEERQRHRAQENFEQARQMLDYFVQVAEQDLAHMPAVLDVRKRLLESALGYYLEFLEQCGDDPEAQSELASSLFRLARVFNQIGSSPDAVVAFEQAREIQERLARQYPDDPEVQRGLFAIYRHLGVLRGRGNLFILGQRSVQDHLGLIPEQRAKVAQLSHDYRKWYENLRRNENLTFDERLERMVQRSRELDGPLFALLQSQQQARLRQISLQLRGTQAFNDPDVAGSLGLTENQLLLIERIKEETRQALQELWASGEQDSTKRRKTRLSHQYAHERIIGLLTVEQMARWRELAGEPFNGELEFYRWKFRCRGSRSRDSYQPKQTEAGKGKGNEKVRVLFRRSAET